MANRSPLVPSSEGVLNAPDPGDQHLGDLLSAVPNAILVTGDLRLVENAPNGASVMSPRSFLG